MHKAILATVLRSRASVIKEDGESEQESVLE